MQTVERNVSVVYMGPKRRTERPRKTKIGTEVAHVTRAVRSTGVDYTLSRFCVAVCGSTLKQLRTITTTVCDCSRVISK